MKQYDAIFIGSGHAAWHGATILKQAGKSVLIIEKDLEGGTCTNYGCDVKILLDGPFEVLHQSNRYQGIGKEGDFTINWPQLMAYKDAVTNPFPQFLNGMFQRLDFDFIKGHSQLIGEHTVLVNGEEIYGENIIIGTGARGARLNIPGQEFLKDSRDFLSLHALPDRFVMIGAGIISLEFTSQALAAYHQDYVATVVADLEKQGVQFHFNQAVASVEEVAKGYLVKTQNGLALEVDYVLDATGRLSNVENIGLGALGIEASARGIKVDDHLRTKYPHIYVSGDVIDKTVPKLTPTAIFESKYITGQILGNQEAISYPAILNLVFTLPRIGQVGVTVKEAKANENLQIIPYKYGQASLFETKNEKDAEITFILDENKHLVGAELISDDAEAILNMMTLIINQKITGQDLGNMIFAFPGVTHAIISQLVAVMR